MLDDKNHAHPARGKGCVLGSSGWAGLCEDLRHILAPLGLGGEFLSIIWRILERKMFNRDATRMEGTQNQL